jgi:2-oxoglutarate ferredoxin oxidoreductase subunit gamma
MKTYNEIIIAGFGGQGVLLAGNILAQSAMEEGLNTTWFPSYGAEMRGGTANSTVIISDDEIGSPIAFNPSGLIALNALSLDKFLSRMSENAVIIANSSIINKVDYQNKNIIFIPISEIADKEIGNIKAANMVAVGALVKALNVPALENVLNAVKTAFAKKEGLSELNIKAVKAGYDYKI